MSDIITIRPRLYFLSPLSPFSLLLTSSHQFSPILWNISPPHTPDSSVCRVSRVNSRCSIAVCLVRSW